MTAQPTERAVGAPQKVPASSIATLLTPKEVAQIWRVSELLPRQGAHAWRRAALYQESPFHSIQRGGPAAVDESSSAIVDERAVKGG